MAGGNRGRGRGGQLDRSPSFQQQNQNTHRGNRTPQATPAQQTPGSSNSRGRGRRGGGPGRGNTTPFAPSNTPGSRSPWSAGRGAGNAGHLGRQVAADAASPGVAGYTSGPAAVCAEDRTLLLIGKDAKMPRVWELRVHPTQRFSTAWLSAVERWVENMVSSSTHQQQQQALLHTAAAASAGPPPVPAEPAELDDDDYEIDESDDGPEAHDLQGELEAAAAAGGGGDSGNADSDRSDDDVYDMLSYLKKMSISDNSAEAAAEPDLDAVSVAATAGSSIVGRRRSRKLGSRAAAAAATGAVISGAAGAGAHAGDDSDSTGSWETDSQAAGELEDQQQELEEQQQVAQERAGDLAPDVEAEQPAEAAAVAGEQQQQLGMQPGAAEEGDEVDSSSDEGYEHFAGSHSDSDDSEMEAALTAAEEQDLLGERGSMQHQQKQKQQSGVKTDAGGAGSSAAAAGSSRQPRVRRGELKRQRWEQQLLVSLRLERQGLTDKEAQQLSSWYSSSPAAQHMSLSKLWLFDNALGDAAAAALAPLIGPHTAELHLSHNQIGVQGAKALLAAVPLQRAKGVKPLWFRIEWNQVDQVELRRFIQEECTARGVVVDIAQEVPVNERALRTDSKGRELNLSWSRPWQEVHVQMPWLSCQRAPPAEAAVLKAAKAVWGQRAAAAAGSSSRETERTVGTRAADIRRKQQQQQTGLSSSRHGGVVAAAAAAAHKHVSPPLMQTPPPPPPPRAAAATPAAAAGSALSSSPAAPAVKYQDGPLMLFFDTSAFLSMLGCPGSVTSTTCFTLKLLQALAGSGRFGRGLSAEQQTFIVLADTVLKQLDSFKNADGGVGGPVRRFLDKGLDEVGPKGLDFLTVLAAHEGEGLVVDRQAAVAGSRSPLFKGTTGQRSDLSIIEVGLFFRTELLAAAAAALAEAGVSAVVDDQLGQEAQPVILVTNDHAQLQLAKSHGLPAFKLAGAGDFEAQITDIIKSGSDLTSSTLRSVMAPAATAGLGAVAGRSLQDDFDGCVSCLRGLLEAYQDLSGLMGRMSMLVAGALPGEEAAVFSEVQQLLQEHQHPQLFEEGSSSGLGAQNGVSAGGGGVSVLEASLSNISALEGSLMGWEDRAAKHHTPSRVLKWAGAGVARAGSVGL